LRVSKESLFSGLNNLKVYSLMHTRYGEYFGFTESEVNELFQRAGLAHDLVEIKEWYNGYQCGDTVIYNPWSILNCLSEQGQLRPYWLNTSDNELIRQLLLQSDTTVQADFEMLFQGKPIQKIIDESIAFQELTPERQSKAALWSLFFSAGYLKVIEQTLIDDYWPLCTLLVPNREVMGLYRHIIKQWLSGKYDPTWYNQFLDQLLSGDVTGFADKLQEIVLQTFSAHDLSKQPEVFYHGFMLGITVSLSNRYDIHSNHEAGFGRYDIALIPKNPASDSLGVILEFKRAQPTDDLETLAQLALLQIQQQQYDAVLHQRGIKKILKIGIAFKGKALHVVHAGK
jgi:hypothetical protein